LGEHTRCDLDAQAENDADYGLFISALLSGFEVPAGDVEAGTRYIVNALRGFSTRHHFDLYHPHQVEIGVEYAPPDEPDREAWMYGYLFSERKSRTDA
jgi:hypothetical protein